MAKLYFRYGAMNSAKSANLLMVAHNYHSQDKPVLLMKPAADTRWDAITSRAIATPGEAMTFTSADNVFDMVAAYIADHTIYAVLLDEAQFVTEEQAEQLAAIVDRFHIPVLCYGLKNRAAKGKLFSGSYGLLYWADTIEEIKNTCSYCNKKATQNLMLINGVPEYHPEEIVMADVDGELRIIPVCRAHYLNPQ
ncbi:MAG: thymidine kinase [Oscillospiraceae bacterium]|nr:thymidine kinase [Oscillospiraceae bacterium]